MLPTALCHMLYHSEPHPTLHASAPWDFWWVSHLLPLYGHKKEYGNKISWSHFFLKSSSHLEEDSSHFLIQNHCCLCCCAHCVPSEHWYKRVWLEQTLPGSLPVAGAQSADETQLSHWPNTMPLWGTRKARIIISSSTLSFTYVEVIFKVSMLETALCSEEGI